MTERPILFTPANYQAILDGSKTQTRRLVKAKHLPFLENLLGGFIDGKWNQRPIPYGVIGDRLWVKEGLCKSPGGLVQYRRDLKVVGWAEWKWQRNTLSPIHMPHRFARLWLEIVEVRVERLREISEEDCLAEGMVKHTVTAGRKRGDPDYDVFALEPGDHCRWELTAQTVYQKLWESIHGAGSWDANPWVWAITFEKVSS